MVEKKKKGRKYFVLWWLILSFLCSASSGLERTPSLLKETWTPLLLAEAVVTLVCGWMRICTWVAAAPATLSATAASRKPTTSEWWSWRCGRSPEETAAFLFWLASSPLISFIKFITEQKTNTAAHSFHGNIHVKKIYHKLLDLSVWLSAVDFTELDWTEQSNSMPRSEGLLVWTHGWLIPVGLAAKLWAEWSWTGFFESRMEWVTNPKDFALNVNQ